MPQVGSGGPIAVMLACEIKKLAVRAECQTFGQMIFERPRQIDNDILGNFERFGPESLLTLPLQSGEP